MNILVAEDNELSAQVLEQLLIRKGHRVRLASNGREALALAEEGGFDLLLLDVHMPELDGFQVVRAVREREQNAVGHLPVIALTARSRKEDRERCLAAGMDDFLTKPVRPAELWAAIDRVMRIHPPRKPPGLELLDVPVLLAACGGDAELLRKMCQSLQTRVPEHLAVLARRIARPRRPAITRSGSQILRPAFGVFDGRRRSGGQPGGYCGPCIASRSPLHLGRTRNDGHQVSPFGGGTLAGSFAVQPQCWLTRSPRGHD